MYKHRKEINSIDELKAAAAFDHVAAAYRDNTRKNKNFIKSDCVMFDVDNTGSDRAADWITYDALRADFPDVEYYTVTSRNHMREKDHKDPRPKFHVYFPIDTITDGTEYSALKAVTKEVYEYFDKYAADTARFFFGNAKAEVKYFEGEKTLTEHIKSYEIHIPPPAAEPPPQAPQAQPAEQPTPPGQITAGKRNSTMSAFAFTMLKKYGDCQKSRQEYVDYSKKCSPPLPAKELEIIWDRAVDAYLRKIAGNSDYIPPREYAKWGEIQPIAVITPPPFPLKHSRARWRILRAAFQSTRRPRRKWPVYCCWARWGLCSKRNITCGQSTKTLSSFRFTPWQSVHRQSEKARSYGILSRRFSNIRTRITLKIYPPFQTAKRPGKN